MPIRINLLAEAQAQEDLRKRDPVKRAAYVGMLLVALALVWFSYVWLEFVMAKKSLSQIQDEMQTHTNAYDQVLANMKDINDDKEKLEALHQLSDARFLQGNLMNAMQKIYVPNVQLIRMTIRQDYDPSDVSSGDGKKSSKKATVTERITLTLDARDSSPNPGDQVNHYKDAIAGQKFFAANLNPTNSIRLSNLSPPQKSFDGRSFVLFSLECHFNDQTR